MEERPLSREISLDLPRRDLAGREVLRMLAISFASETVLVSE